MTGNENCETIVQISLPTAEYERFRAVAKREGKTSEDALEEAINEYVSSRVRPTLDDPFFSYEPPSVDGSVTATRTEKYLYGDE